MRGVRWMVCVLAALMASTASARQKVEVEVARNSADQLVGFVEGELPIRIPPSVFEGFEGWAAGESGFHSLALDEPAEDRFVLPETVNIQFVFLGSDDDIQMLNETGTAWMQPGDTFLLGAPFFDLHPFINIVHAEPNRTYHIRVRLHDLSGQFADSDEVTLEYAPVRACFADWDFSGSVTSQDFFDFLTAFFATEADINEDGTTNSQDFFDFLSAFFEPC